MGDPISCWDLAPRKSLKRFSEKSHHACWPQKGSADSNTLERTTREKKQKVAILKYINLCGVGFTKKWRPFKIRLLRYTVTRDHGSGAKYSETDLLGLH